MKRDHFSLTVAIPPADEWPTLGIEYGGSSATLREHLQTPTGEPLREEDVDIAFRKQAGETGVLSVADRHTGAFVCELNAESAPIERLVAAAEEGDEQYRVVMRSDDDSWEFEQRTLLVYDETGQLRRSCSLIPGSVEL